ncbi:MAG: MFS transporter [Candidatus Hodarchaeales archaeon]|jgi:MFS family permease
MQRNNILIYLVTAFIALGQSFSRGNFPSYVEVLGGSIVNYGFLQSIQTFSNLLFLLPAAYLADRIGHKKLILSGSIIYAIAYTLMVFTPHWEFLLLGVFGVGSAGGMIMPSQVAILAHDNPTRRINVFTRNETTRWASLALGYFVSSFFFILFQNEFSHRNLQLTMVITLVMVILAIIPSMLLTDSDLWKNNAIQEPNVKEVFKINSPEGIFVVGFLFISLIIGFGAGFLVPFTQPYFVKRFSLGPSEINFIMAGAQIATATFMGLIPFLAKKFSDTKVIYLTEGLSIPLVIILAYSQLLPLSLVVFLSRIALMNMSRPAQTTIMQKYIPETYRATVQSLTQVADRLGRGFSPSISALMIEESSDFHSSFTITAVMYSFAVAILFFLTRNLRKKTRQRIFPTNE